MRNLLLCLTLVLIVATTAWAETKIESTLYDWGDETNLIDMETRRIIFEWEGEYFSSIQEIVDRFAPEYGYVKANLQVEDTGPELNLDATDDKEVQ